MMLDIIENINKADFEIFVCYKPEYAEWGQYEIESILKAEAKILPLRGREIFDVKGFLDFYRVVKKEKIDIVHCWDVLGVPARIIGTVLGAKIVVVLANPPPARNFGISKKHYWINKATSILVDGFVTCSNEVLKKYQRQKPICMNGKLQSVIYNCVDVPDLDTSAKSLLKIRRKYNLDPSDMIITNIGYFNEQKAQCDILRAFKTVVENKPDVRLIIVGWGRLEAELKGLARKLELNTKVLFTGRLEKPAIFEILSITDLFVLSSHWEGFGIVLAEAMAAGKPVISTDTDGGREVVVDGETGLIVPVNSPEIMGDKILHVMGKPKMMAAMGEKGKERVKTFFNIQNYISGYENFYNELLRC